MAGLNVVALISGGKDSFFSILHCQANGHRVVALANLHPTQEKDGEQVDDLESFMYQTIGHAVIPLYEEALGLPLFREGIRGGAVVQEKSYSFAGASSTDSADETESLVPLLRRVLDAHPEVNAVSTGAILSDYQRTRIENVAIRLGLIPLSYLWQWPSLPPQTPTSLLEDMASVGQDARIIKVASGGLDESFLWQNVADRRTVARLSKAAERFGTYGDGAVLGEGGEYETLAVAGPAPLWKARIEVPTDGIRIIPGEAGCAAVKLSRPSIAPLAEGQAQADNLRIPPLLDDPMQELLDTILSAPHLPDQAQDPASSLDQLVQDQAMSAAVQGTGMVVLQNLTGTGETVAEQTHSIMEQLISRPDEFGHLPIDVAYSTIVLRDMADFGSVNAVYGNYFRHPNPPARITIACAEVLPADTRVSISFTCIAGARKGLHVQSRSYWAPANIGTYSQAIGILENAESAASGAVFIAGQIPLVPATMQVVKSPSGSPTTDFAFQTTLALQHLVRIGAVMELRQWVCAIAFVAVHADGSGPTPINMAAIISQAWEGLHKKSAPESSADADDDFDVWDLKHGAQSSSWMTQSNAAETPSDGLESAWIPPLYVILVDSLPRDSNVEWVGFGKTSTDHHPSTLQLRCLLDVFLSRIIRQEFGAI